MSDESYPHEGQEVICVDTNWVRQPKSVTPVKGRIYTIERICPSLVEGEGLMLDLVELPNNPTSWLTFHFRPTKKRTTDISCFTGLLTTKPVKEDA